MNAYRLYFLDRAGHFARAEEFEADDDHVAIEAALTRGGETPTELWCEGRKISRKVSRQDDKPVPGRAAKIR